MKLHFIAAHQKVGPLRKALGLADGTSRSYPKAAKLTSFEEELAPTDGVAKYRKVLLEHAHAGHALYKGLFLRKLNNESRKHKTDKDAKTQLLVLDIDGLTMEGFKAGPKTSADVQEVAEHVLAMLPEDLQNVSYVASASSSFGTKNNAVGIHIHIMLSRAIPHAHLKEWLTSLNYTQENIYSKLTLTPSKLALKSIVDPCLAEPSRIVYIAPPQFGPNATNPFKNIDDRIIAVEKEHATFDIDPQIAKLDAKMSITNLRRDEKLKELQKALGITTKRRKTKQLKVGNDKVIVVTEPERCMMELAYYDDEFVRYNLPGGDSGAYWVRRDNPEVVFCFKPDERPFLFREAAPDAYARHIERFGGAFTEVVTQGQKRRVIHEMFIDRPTDTYYTMERDLDTDEVLELQPQGAETAKEFMAEKGHLVPDPVPSCYITFDPLNDEPIYMDGQRRYINSYRRSTWMCDNTPHYMVDAAGRSLLGYGNAWMLMFDCPHIYNVIHHLLGDDEECYEHFVNWLARMFHTREKNKTAWLVHGTEGTGKGLLFHNILAPLMGAEYSRLAKLDQIVEDQFNSWLGKTSLLFVDEFNLNAATKAVKAANELKSYITEPTFNARAMRVEQTIADQFLNLILATNDLDALSGWIDKRRLNIAARQEIMLQTRFTTPENDDEPTIQTLRSPMADQVEFDKILAAELPLFAAFLRNFKFDRNKASTAIENTSKQEAIESGMSSVDTFFRDMRYGAFDAFSDILDKPEIGIPQRDLERLRNCKNVLRRLVPYVNTDSTCWIRTEDLLAIYSFLAGKEISENAFGRMFKKQNMTSLRKRQRQPAGVERKLANPVWCVGVELTHPDKETMKLINELHINVGGVNVTPIRDNEPPEQAQETQW